MAAKNKKRVREVFEARIYRLCDNCHPHLLWKHVNLSKRKWQDDDRVRVTVELLPGKKAKGE